MGDVYQKPDLFKKIASNDVCKLDDFVKLMGDYFGVTMREEVVEKIITQLNIDTEKIGYKQFGHLIYIYMKFNGDERLALFYALDGDKNDLINQGQFKAIMYILNVHLSSGALKQLFYRFSRNNSLSAKYFLEAFMFITQFIRPYQ